MKLVPVNSLPRTERAEKHDLQRLIEDFSNSDYRIALLDWKEGEWKNVISCHTCLHRAVRQSKRPIKVCKRGNNVYLIKI